jgi:hypothetical protein
MPPGDYTPDRTEGITRVEDLTQPLVEVRSRSYRRRSCPGCGRRCYRDTPGRRVLQDLGCLRRDRPRALQVVYSKHRGEGCGAYVSADLSDLAPPGSHYTQRVISVAVRGQAVAGMTAEASPLYPRPLAVVFGDSPPQVCECHILKELTQAVRRVRARLRKRLAAQAPARPRGRPPDSRRASGCTARPRPSSDGCLPSSSMATCSSAIT